MGNIYIYGCSFSSGAKIDVPQILHWEPFFMNQFGEYAWYKQVSKYFNVEYYNNSLGGGGNLTTLSRIIKDSRNFTANDKVIIGLTKGERFSLEPLRLAEQKLWDHPIDFMDLNEGLVNEFFRQVDDLGVSNFKKMFYPHETFKTYSEDDFLVLMTMFLQWRVGKGELYDDFWLGLFKSFIGLLSRAGVKVYLWHHDLWDSFETITDWLKDRTNFEQRIKDGHWSPNGNTVFASFVIEQIEKDVGYWNQQTLLDTQHKFNHNYIKNLKPYIDCNFEADYSWYDEKKYPWAKNREDIYKYATSRST
tara:strand:+ start:365 stop:1279 length:915 start_codon:yes stop_codon:yes gene_type:complete